MVEVDFNVDYIKTISGILKFVEIIMVVVTFGILRGTNSMYYFYDEDAFYMGVGVCFSAMLITPLLLICYIMGKTEIQKTVMEFSLNFLFFFFFGIFAVLGFVHFPDTLGKTKDSGLAMSSFSLFASLAYLADTVFAVHNYNK